MSMFEELIDIYHLKGADTDFYRALPESSDFSCWLSPTYLREINRDWLFLEEEPFFALLAAAEKLSALPDLCALASSARSLLFETDYSVDYLVHLGFPRPDTEDPLINDFFGLIVHLSGIKIVEQRYRDRGIPLSYMRQSYRSVKIWVNSFHAFFGRWGHNRECPRMVFIENFRFLRIGRLEFEMDCFYGKVIVLRNKNGKEVLLSEGDVLMNPDGLITNTNGCWDPHCIRTGFSETPDAYYGHLISNGRISAGISCFKKDDWKPLIRRGEKCVNVHIPRDGHLDLSEAMNSLPEAANFFRTWFPEWEFPVFQCHSWLLDDTLEKLLGDRSNIVRFQKLFSLFPEESNDYGAMISIFSEAPFDMETWEPTTSLQKKVKDLYHSGGKLHKAGGYISLERMKRSFISSP